MILPGFLISWATFPGVIVHEAAHMLFCRVFGLAVFDVCFFRFVVTGPAGYVVHEETDNFTASFFVGLGPFIVNTLLCIVICLPAAIQVQELEVRDPIAYLLYWIGLSIGMQAFPSAADLTHIRKLAPVAARAGNVLAILSYPLVGVLFVLNLLRFFWADLLYGLAVGIWLPLAILRWIAGT